MNGHFVCGAPLSFFLKVKEKVEEAESLGDDAGYLVDLHDVQDNQHEPVF